MQPILSYRIRVGRFTAPYGVPKDDAGRMRVIASKYIEGSPIGPFRYHGTRSDDANDVVPHEHRRELRGLRLFAAWTNHDDTRAQNTQASWVAAAGKHHLRHWLIDFGSTFGSGSVDLQLANLSFHYWLPMDQVKKNALGFGFHTPYYRKVKWPNFPKYEGVGRWESEYFDPLAWRNEAGENLRLSLEPGQAIRIGSERLWKHLQRDLAVELRISRLIDLAL